MCSRVGQVNRYIISQSSQINNRLLQPESLLLSLVRTTHFSIEAFNSITAPSVDMS